MLLHLPSVLLLAGPATAGAPAAVVLPSHAVEGTVSIGLPATEVMGRLADPTWVSAVDGGGTTVTVRARDGACLLADFTSPSTLMTVRYTVRQCPTPSGYLLTLVSSDTFASYESEWHVTAEGSGSLLTYRVALTPRLPLPVSLITGTIRHDVLAMLEHFADKFPPSR